MTGSVLAFGASGKFAGMVVPALTARGMTVRGFAKDEAAAATARANGAGDVAIGDLHDRAAIERVLDGIERVFYLAPAFMSHEVEAGRGIVEACVAAGVKRLVFSSVIHPVLSGLCNHANKAPVEEALLDSGMEYSFLHPTVFFQNYAASWNRIVETGVVAEPWSTETRFSRVDYRDVAEVAAIALTEDRLLDGTFELCAEGALDRHGVAALVTEVLGREIKAARIDPGTLGPEGAPMQPMFRHYDRFGLRGNALTLRAILGREPRTLLNYFKELSRKTGGVH